MSIFYSASTGGFYNTAINANLFVEHIETDPSNGETIDRDMVPDPNGPIADAVEISEDEWLALLAAQAEGRYIEADSNGHPFAADPVQQPLDQLKVTLCVRVDAAADAAYETIGGPSPGRLAEYQQANADAVAFKSAGYAGDPPATVSCWAQAMGWTGQKACDDILATAAQWGNALVLIRTARLVGKANVTAAGDATSAEAAADAAITDIGAVAAGL